MLKLFCCELAGCEMMSCNVVDCSAVVDSIFCKFEEFCKLDVNAVVVVTVITTISVVSDEYVLIVFVVVVVVVLQISLHCVAEFVNVFVVIPAVVTAEFIAPVKRTFENNSSVSKRP